MLFKKMKELNKFKEEHKEELEAFQEFAEENPEEADKLMSEALANISKQIRGKDTSIFDEEAK